MITTRAAVAALSALLLTSCAGSDAPDLVTNPTATPTTSVPVSTPTASSAPTRSCAAAFPADALPDGGASAGGILGLKSAASAVHAGYDRVVFTLGGSAQPGWRVEYDTSPRSDGSGDPVSVQGGAALRVILRDVGYPGDTGVPDPAVKRFSPTGTVAVKEVVLDTVFEGQYTAFIGVDSTRPFRVFRLAGPARVVVDVRHC